MNRTIIEDRIETLKRERGAAKLDGRKFDDSAIGTLETELKALDDADGERARRDRAAAQAEVEEQRAKLRGRVAELEAERLAAVGDAERAARELAGAIGRVIEISMDEASTLHAATGAVPMPLHRTDVENRLSGRLAAVMQTVKGNRCRVGHIDWIAGHYKAETDWKEAEQAVLANHLQHINGN